MLPQLRKLEQAFPDDLAVVGVHSGKFIAERVTANIRRAAERLGAHHPIVNDRQFRVWRAYAVGAWPTITLVDAAGYVVVQQAGEIPAEALMPVIERMIGDARATWNGGPPPLDLQAPFEPSATGALAFPAKVVPDDRADRLFIADTGHHRVLVLRLDAGGLAGAVEAVVGTGEAGFDDGPFDGARFNEPHGLSWSGRHLFVADTGNHAIRRVDLGAHTVTTIAGNGEQARRFNVSGRGRDVALNSPWDVLALRDRMYVAMAGTHQLWTVDEDGRANPFVGSGAEAIVDGAPAGAALAQPSGLATDAGRLFVADSESSAVRAIDLPDGTAATIVGTGLFDFGLTDGVGDEARLQHPLGIAWRAGLLYVADGYNDAIRVVDPETREVTTWLGADAGLWEPGGIAIAGERVWIADTNNHRIVTATLGSSEVREMELRGL